MTNENKQLLLKDLCARLPYDLKVEVSEDGTNRTSLMYPEYINDIKYCVVDSIKPYLRPMSSMTKEERKEWLLIDLEIHLDNGAQVLNGEEVDFLLSHHFDYRGLIEKGLALEAPEGMYKTE